MTNEADSSTPFCIGCGQWVFEFDELLASPFVYCIFCDPKTKMSRKRKSKMMYFDYLA